jgi:hypothetical protein
MAGNSETTEARNVSLYPSDWAPVDAISTQYKLPKSAALRIIIREWQAMKQIATLRTSALETSEHSSTGSPSLYSPEAA